MRPETAPWWRQAEADLAAGFENFQHGRYWVASWLAQQAVEKGLKALLLDRTAAIPPRTHDLEYLGRLASVPPVIAALLSYLDALFAIVRYPDDSGGPPPARAVSASAAASDLVSAEKVVEWIRNEIAP